jgi:hypothetical protein
MTKVLNKDAKKLLDRAVKVIKRKTPKKPDLKPTIVRLRSLGHGKRF